MNTSQIYILASIIVLAVITLLLFIIGKRRKEIPINKTHFAIGLLIVGVAVVLLLMNVIKSGVATVIEIVGIGLIATSGRSNIKRMRCHKSASKERERERTRLNSDGIRTRRIVDGHTVT